MIALLLVYLEFVLPPLHEWSNIEYFILSLFLIIRRVRHFELRLGMVVYCHEPKPRPAVLKTHSIQFQASHLNPQVLVVSQVTAPANFIIEMFLNQEIPST